MEFQKYDLRTDGRTNGPTDRQTWVGARDACASKNDVRNAHLNSNGRIADVGEQVSGENIRSWGAVN